MQQPVVVAYGAGRDSTAMLVRMWKEKWRPDAILFANVGSEKAGTYAYIPVLREWLKKVDFPDLTVVRYRPLFAPYRSIEGNCTRNATLPGATFGYGSCTMKWKIEPQNKWTRAWELAQRAWAGDQRVVKLVGFEADEDYRLKRADCKAHSGKGSPDSHLYEYQYPLMDWGLTLAGCIEEIQSVGLPVPPKSACFMCPNMKPDEVDRLDPIDRSRIILMELSAEPFNRKVAGLWRRSRKSDGRPGSITEYILEKGLEIVPLADICHTVCLNSNCQKARNDGEYTFQPPHNKLRLRDLLIARGEQVPKVEISDSIVTSRAEGVYREDFRDVPGMVDEWEMELHDEIAEDL
jgi:hypothetical protein